jgi:hypothetical protein
MNTSSFRFAVASLLLGASFTAPAASAAKLVTEPLVIAGAIHEVLGPSLRCPSKLGGTLVGHGNDPVLGQVAFLGKDCVMPNGPLLTFSDGRITLLTASGEVIYANYSGQAVPTGEGTKVVYSNATFQIIGGTGRYHKASGGGDITGSQDLVTGAGTIKLNGKITHRE